MVSVSAAKHLILKTNYFAPQSVVITTGDSGGAISTIGQILMNYHVVIGQTILVIQTKNNPLYSRMKLISIKKSTKPDKKMMAIFLSDFGPKIVHFGAVGYEDFTTSLSQVKKDAYIKRHEVRENHNNPYTAGALSRWILWNKPTIKASIADYKKRFNL
jgi:hypothetical protein